MRKAIMILTMSVMPVPAFAQNVEAPPGYADLARLQVPVVEGDIADRPYRIVGHISKGIRKATMFSKSASREKVFRELWEDARKMGADAVVKAQFGEAHITALSWGAREARGVAIKFLTDAEIAALPPRAVAPAVAEAPAPAATETPAAAAAAGDGSSSGK